MKTCIPKYYIINLYKFKTLKNPVSAKKPLLKMMKEANVRGTLLLSNEGINGSVSGEKEGVNKVLSYLILDLGLTDLFYQASYHYAVPFNRAKVKIRKEIVTLGVDDLNTTKLSGIYINPKNWNELILNPEVLLIDSRNDYEIKIGSFKNSVNPNTKSFREFPTYAAQNLDKNKHKKIAMFCTGGVRCEKSTAYLKTQGFEEIYHLKGGILKYLSEIKEDDTLWEGECFVFDSRISVNHRLEKGKYDQCYACRCAITELDKKRPEYHSGLSCHNCYGRHNKKKTTSLLERRRQNILSSKPASIASGAKNNV